MSFDILENLGYGITKLVITSITCVVVVVFYTIWIVKLIKHLNKFVRLYRVNKRTDFRDKREQDRILYNYETHIVKDIILIILSCAEACEAFGGMVSAIFTTIQERKDVEINKFLSENITCTPEKLIGNVKIISNLNEVILYNLDHIQTAFFPIFAIAFLLLLSFLTEYLSKRYLNHPYKKCIYKHIFLFATQTTIIFILSNKVIILGILIIAPILVLIDWFILVRNSRKLRNVLKSNVRDLNLHLRHRNLYKQQLRELQYYTIFIPILLTALFFGVLAIILSYYTQFVSKIIIATCEYQHQNPIIFKGNIFVSRYGTLVMISIHFILLGLPLYAISIQMLVAACLKRIRSREEHYRFNYSSFPNNPAFE